MAIILNYQKKRQESACNDKSKRVAVTRQNNNKSATVKKFKHIGAAAEGACGQTFA